MYTRNFLKYLSLLFKTLLDADVTPSIKYTQMLVRVQLCSALFIGTKQFFRAGVLAGECPSMLSSRNVYLIYFQLNMYEKIMIYTTNIVCIADK